MHYIELKKRSESKAASEIHYPYKRLRKDVDSDNYNVLPEPK